MTVENQSVSGSRPETFVRISVVVFAGPIAASAKHCYRAGLMMAIKAG
jgi:hypothetical protein